MSPPVMVSDVAGVRVLTLNRPESRNALDGALISALYEALVDADAEPSARAVVLTGTDPAFCAGIDLKEAARDGAAYFDKHRAEPCIPQVARMATPVIGAINGATFTGGLELALGCDFLIASERAVFADTHARVGILPGGGLTARLPPLVGPAWARRMSYAGEVIDAALALRIGLVTEVVAHDRLLDRAVEVAAMAAEVPSETMRALKGVYVSGTAGTIDAALAAERTAAEERRPDLALLEQRRVAVTERNRRQVRTGP
jgi:enoyl-CoA hydratase